MIKLNYIYYFDIFSLFCKNVLFINVISNKFKIKLIFKFDQFEIKLTFKFNEFKKNIILKQYSRCVVIISQFFDELTEYNKQM